MKFYEKLILVNINNLYILSYSLRFNSDRWITSGFNLDHHMHMGHYLFPFFYFFYILFLLNLKIKWATPLLSPGHALFWRCPPTESLKKPYFPLPLSILAGTNLNMLLLFFFLQPPFDSIENPSPIRFPGKFILVWFPRKSMQNPQRKPKKLLFFCSLCFLDLF